MQVTNNGTTTTGCRTSPTRISASSITPVNLVTPTIQRNILLRVCGGFHYRDYRWPSRLCRASAKIWTGSPGASNDSTAWHSITSKRTAPSLYDCVLVGNVVRDFEAVSTVMRAAECSITTRRVRALARGRPSLANASGWD